MTVDELHELVVEQRALERWTGEGGSPADRFGVMAEIQRKIEVWQLEANCREPESEISRTNEGRSRKPPVLH
jgi:hypothetical protein